MIIKSVELETVCGITSTLPRNELPEVAFAGKSNVGKSSMLNALINRKSLARTSSTPGKTQTINYYNVNQNLYFVDLPGYGYAKVSKEVQAKWGKMIERYLHKSPTLKAVFLLIDIRHEPGQNDVQMYEWVKANGFTPVIVATKADKISKGQISRQTSIIRKTLKADSKTVIIPFSAETKQGRDEIWAEIERRIAEEPEVLEIEAEVAAEQTEAKPEEAEAAAEQVEVKPE